MLAVSQFSRQINAGISKTNFEIEKRLIFTAAQSCDLCEPFQPWWFDVLVVLLFCVPLYILITQFILAENMWVLPSLGSWWCCLIKALSVSESIKSKPLWASMAEAYNTKTTSNTPRAIMSPENMRNEPSKRTYKWK